MKCHRRLLPHNYPAAAAAGATFQLLLHLPTSEMLHDRVINGKGCSVILLQLRQRLPLDILTALNAPTIGAFLRRAGQFHASDMEDANVRHFPFLLELEI